MKRSTVVQACAIFHAIQKTQRSTSIHKNPLSRQEPIIRCSETMTNNRIRNAILPSAARLALPFDKCLEYDVTGRFACLDAIEMLSGSNLIKTK